MSRRTWLLWFTAFALIAALLAIWSRKGGNQLLVPQKVIENSSTPQSESTIADSVTPSPAAPVLNRSERTQLLLDAANVNINFWGKVVDEAGIGLSGVHIEYYIQRAGRLESNGSIAEDSVRSSVDTNADGLFSILNVNGTTLSFEGFVKAGYEVSSNQRRVFGYFGTPAVHVPKSQSPHVFILQTKAILGEVSSIRKEIRMPWDGTPIRLDLDSGNVSPSGMLELTATRTALTGRFGWHVSLSIYGGEVQEAKEGTALIAPENGYLPTWQYGYEINANSWRFAHDVNIYYKINGMFGRLKLQIYADATPNDVSVYLERFVNSSGGRNVEKRQ